MTLKRVGVEYRSLAELAGSYYGEMMRSEGSALGHLASPDVNVRLAAVLICEATWKCGPDPRIVLACQSIASSNADESARISAVGSLSRVLKETKSVDNSRFLANLINDRTNSPRVQIAAYWALRLVQFGLQDEDSFREMIYHVKEFLRTHPGQMSEETVKFKLLGGSLSDPIWDAAEEIDWSFVNQFLSSTRD